MLKYFRGISPFERLDEIHSKWKHCVPFVRKEFTFISEVIKIKKIQSTRSIPVNNNIISILLGIFLMIVMFHSIQ